MQIVRFGVGHRRLEGPSGSRNVQGQVIASDQQGVIAELAFGRHAAIAPHSNPNASWFVVIEGGGFVQVGEEQARVAAGESIFWPPGVAHGAWTDQSQMRALVVEFPATGGARQILEGRGDRIDHAQPDGSSTGRSRGEGRLTEGGSAGRRYDPSEGEPM
ncbi:MAG TPA: cupin domain-containing protein [Candidatus Saccharimonadales bacterium]|nr:cupin domain-containing protein [Candidatus Saccharimonadales bacterium]